MNTTKQNNGAAKRRWIIGGLAVAALGAVLWAAYRPRPLVVETATVAEGRFEQVIEEDGRLRLQQRYTVTAPTAAQLQRPVLKVGDAVRAGDVIAVLAPAAPAMIDTRTRSVLGERVGSAEAARAAAGAHVKRLQAALAQATLEAERAAQLAKDKFIAPSAADQARLAREAAQQALRAGQAEQAAAEHTLGEARAALQRAQPSGPSTQGLWSLTSPVNGRVLKLHKESAEPVTAGQPLLEIGDTAALEAVVDVLSGDAPRIPAGAVVQLATGRAQPPLAGQVARIEPQAFTKVSALGIEEQRVNVVVSLDARSDDLQRLGDGYRVDARITVSAQDGALLVPSAALVRDGESGWRVFVVEGGKARARSVTLKDRHAEHAWVQDGLKAGETVILYPGSTMTDGQPVRLRQGAG